MLHTCIYTCIYPSICPSIHACIFVSNTGIYLSMRLSVPSIHPCRHTGMLAGMYLYVHTYRNTCIHMLHMYCVSVHSFHPDISNVMFNILSAFVDWSFPFLGTICTSACCCLNSCPDWFHSFHYIFL